jgi:outer membrane lipoprotein-sorting protein
MKKTLLFLLILTSFSAGAQITVDQLLDKMVAAVDNLKTATYTLNQSERIKGKMRDGVIDTRLQASGTFKVYLKITAPAKDAGTEILYVDGERGGKCLVNPINVPINVNLSVYDSRVTKDQHHSMLESGFKYFKSIITQVRKKYADKIDDYVKLSNVKWLGKDYYKADINYTDFVYENYTVLAGEDVRKIARKKFINEYMILEYNKLEDYDDVKAGQVIKIPSAYAKRTVLYIDKVNFLPVIQELYDEKGLYEKYSIVNLKINPVFPSDEFTKDCKTYNF